MTEQEEEQHPSEPQASMERLDLGADGGVSCGVDDDMNNATPAAAGPVTVSPTPPAVVRSDDDAASTGAGPPPLLPSAAASGDNDADTDTTEEMDTGNSRSKSAGKDNSKDDDNDDNDDDLSLSSSSSSSSTGSTIDDKTSSGSSSSASEALAKAVQCKDEGNAKFQAEQFDVAARSYRQGCAHLKKHVDRPPAEIQDEPALETQIEACYVALQTNLSTTLFKQAKYRQSERVATKLLGRNPLHVKALYRRALAHRKLGQWDNARADLKAALQAEPANGACKKEFASLKKEMDDAKDKQRAALAKAFSNKSSSLLYDDKESALQKKQQKEKEDKKREQELYKKRKQEWEDECVKRMAKNEPALSFDEWEKEQQEQEKARKEQEERERKAREKEREEALRRERKEKEEAKKKKGGDSGSSDKDAAADDDDDDDDDVLTEKELAMMRGYKKTKDGRVTSYFTRELSEEERVRQQALDIAPKRLNETATSTSSIASTASAHVAAHGPPKRLDTTDNNGNATAPRSLTSSASDMKGRSAWNLAGTWEEKDTTPWCTEQLRKRLEEASYRSLANESGLDVIITTLDKLEGHASVAMAAGKKRYIFEYEATIKYEIQSRKQDENAGDAKPTVVASGTAELPDISSIHIDDDLEINFTAWKKRPKAEAEANAVKARSDFVDHLRQQVKSWVKDFNEQY
jgi:Activator of Hsp90 ATPase, N-terminal/Tetratricopeptide repeat